MCIDLLPNATPQAAERSDILNVGGSSDEVFTVIDNFVNGHYGSALWREESEAVTLSRVFSAARMLAGITSFPMRIIPAMNLFFFVFLSIAG